jgi:hypothetical protein
VTIVTRIQLNLGRSCNSTRYTALASSYTESPSRPPSFLWNLHPPPTMPSPSDSKKFTVLHIGDDIKYNPSLYASFAQKFTIIQPSLEERHRDAFIAALKENRWGAFHAILRPFWNTGGEMGRSPRLPPALHMQDLRVRRRRLRLGGHPRALRAWDNVLQRGEGVV